MSVDHFEETNRVEIAANEKWYVVYHAIAVTDKTGEMREFDNEADATACLLRCEAAGRPVA